MIRKWTRIITLPINFLLMKKLYLRYRYKSFRKALMYKKLHFKRTKFRRKQYAKLKHLYNWQLYVQIWHSWTSNFSWIFYLTKFQYIKNFNEYEFISYNSYFFNTKQSKLINNFNFFINCFISKKALLYNNNKNFKINQFSFFFKNFSNFYSYPSLPSHQNFSNLTPTISFSSFPLIFQFEQLFFKINEYEKLKNYNFELIKLFNLILNIILIILLEFKKSINYLFYYNLKLF